jgi:hypothetical protein
MREVVFWFFCAVGAACLPAANAQLLITEFAADNKHTLTDEDGEYADWIEVGNLGTQPVNLGGWTLTDDPDDRRKWVSPATNLNGGAYLVVFASDKDRAVPADNNRAERELRPLVIARKVSFGSQSEAGAHTREALMSVLHTLRKRTDDLTAAFQRALDRFVTVRWPNLPEGLMNSSCEHL